MILSVICPALICRDGMSPILHSIADQASGKPVELLVLADNGAMSIGEKMNHLYTMARGEWTAAVADDDNVTPDYVDSLLEVLQDKAPDAVTFDFQYVGERCKSPAGIPGGASVQRRGLHPVAAIRTSICREFDCPKISQGEDSVMRNWLSKRVHDVERIKRVLYRYNFRPAKPEFYGNLCRPVGMGVNL